MVLFASELFNINCFLMFVYNLYLSFALLFDKVRASRLSYVTRVALHDAFHFEQQLHYIWC